MHPNRLNLFDNTEKPMPVTTSRKKTVYIAMSADILHPGHLNIIREGQKLGEVVIGLLTDRAIASYKRVPLMDYEQRLEMISNIKGITRVVAQTTLDYRPNLHELRPDYVVHGSDWQQGIQSQARQQVIDTLAEWGGLLIEPDYTEGISSTTLQARLKASGVSPTTRLKQLQRLISAKDLVRVMEAHNGLSALIVENIQSQVASAKPEQFDAIWVSSLTDSLAKGKPDTEVVDRTSRLATINQILEVTTKPIIVDGDTGGHIVHFVDTVRSLERLGVSAVVIEDKTGLKQNSFHSRPSEHQQAAIPFFAAKIKAGLAARVDDDFMVIARIESLVVGAGQTDALNRAQAYLDAGASAIMIHSKDSSAADIKEFAASYDKLKPKKPLMLVPTSYNKLYETELSELGASIVVYANQLLRAAYPAMERAALSILENHRAYEVEELCTPTTDLLNMFA